MVFVSEASHEVHLTLANNDREIATHQVRQERIDIHRKHGAYYTSPTCSRPVDKKEVCCKFNPFSDTTNLQTNNFQNM